MITGIERGALDEVTKDLAIAEGGIMRKNSTTGQWEFSGLFINEAPNLHALLKDRKQFVPVVFGMEVIASEAVPEGTAFLVDAGTKEPVPPGKFHVGTCTGNDGPGPACCDRAGEYNGFPGPQTFTCPNRCGCHD